MEYLTATERLAIAFHNFDSARKAVMNHRASSAERYAAIDKADDLEALCDSIKADLRNTMGISNARQMIRAARELAATF
jgi:hypothetical protein